jgi:hypothetical protein
MGSTGKHSRLGPSLATFGVLLIAIKVGLTSFDIAHGGGPFLTFSAVFFILAGVALMFRRSST